MGDNTSWKSVEKSPMDIRQQKGMIMEWYEDLANAIIERAVDDYIVAVRYLYYLIDNKYGAISKIAQDEEKRVHAKYYTSTELQCIYERQVNAQRKKVKDIENFFFSQWYGVLTKVDGKSLLSRIKTKIKEEYGIDCDLL